MSADTSTEFDTCAECGEPFETEPAGTVYHVTADGDRDYDRDADHVAINDDGYGDVIRDDTRGSGRHFVVIQVRFEMDEMDGSPEGSAEIALDLTREAISAHWAEPDDIEVVEYGEITTERTPR